MDILLIDSHVTTGLGLECIFKSFPGLGYNLKQCYSCSSDFINDPNRGQGDIIVVGSNIKDVEPLTFIKYLKALKTNEKVVFYSCFFNRELILQAIQSGANGIISKNATKPQLINGLQEVFSDVSFTCVGKVETSKPIKQYNVKTINPKELTNREQEILNYITEGITNKEISGILNISQSTVEFHRRNIYSKLDVRNVIELMVKLQVVSYA